MIECGFDHDVLMAMDEAEFAFLLDSRIDLDEARAEAEREAAAKVK
ncbi:MAG: hypothetical protein KDJ29_19885 [Hyphomicrobiales bacterium]|nr:hypothetical protein [Hyphomicrobiales bacterium]